MKNVQKYTHITGASSQKERERHWDREEQATLRTAQSCSCCLYSLATCINNGNIWNQSSDCRKRKNERAQNDDATRLANPIPSFQLAIYPALIPSPLPPPTLLVHRAGLPVFLFALTLMSQFQSKCGGVCVCYLPTTISFLIHFSASSPPIHHRHTHTHKRDAYTVCVCVSIFVVSNAASYFLQNLWISNPFFRTLRCY